MPIHVEEIGGRIELSSVYQHAIDETRDAIFDIAERIEAEARRQAPVGDTGQLSRHPVDLEHDIRIQDEFFQEEQRGGVVTDIPLFGGGTALRGRGGRFVRRAPAGLAVGTVIPEIRGVFQPGRAFVRVAVKVAEVPRHAIWVHDGTGIYGPRRHVIVPRFAPYLKFSIDGRIFRRRWVKGQRPQPFLSNAFAVVNGTYIPLRLRELELRI